MSKAPNMAEIRRLLEELRERLEGFVGQEALRTEVLDGLNRAMDKLAAAGGEEALRGDAMPAGVGDVPGADRPCCGVASEEFPRLHRTLRARSRSNQAMISATDESQYLQDVCRVVVEDCGHAMVWIGYAEQDADKTVRPVASSGFDEGYLETLNLTWADSERGRGPTGTAIRRGKPCVCANMQHDPKFSPWRQEALKRGYASSVVLPLMNEGRAFGAITIYAREPDAFSQEEVALLSELTQDLSFGIQSIRLRQAHAQSEELLRRSEERYRSIVELSPDAIFVNQDGRIAYVNPAGMDLFGAAESGQILGRSPFELFHPEYHAKMRDRIETILRDGSVPLTEGRIVRLDGALREVEVAASRIDVQDGRAIQVVLRDVTERKRAEEALARSLAETQQRAGETEAVLAAMNDAVLMYDAGMNVARANPGFIPVYGFDPVGLNVREIIAKTQCRNVDGTPLPLDGQPTPRALKGEAVLNQQFRITRLDGQERVLETSAMPLRAGGRIAGTVTVWHDITERKRAEEALRESEERFRTLFVSMNEGYYLSEIIYDDGGAPCDYRFLEVNPAFEQILGMGRDQIIGRGAKELVPSLSEHWMGVFRSVAATGTPVDCDFFSEALDRHFEAFAFRPAEGQFAALVADITERDRAERALRESEHRFRLALKNAPVSVAMQDHDLVFQWAYNQRTRQPEEIVGKTDADLFAEEEVPQILETKRRVLASGNEARVAQWVTSNGSRRFLDIYYEPLRDAAAKVTGIGIAAVDLTEQKLAEDALKESEARFRAAFDDGSVAMALTALDTTLMKTNAAFCRLLGFSEAELTGRRFTEITHPDDLGDNLPGIQRLVSGEIPTFRMEKRYIRKDGTVIWVDMSTASVRDDQGRPAYLVTHVHDITERKRAEEALRESERRERERAEELAVLFEAVPMPVFIARDPDCLHLRGNRLADEILRIPHGDELSMSAPDEDRPQHFRVFKDGRELRLDELPAQRAARGEQVRDLEITLAFDDGMLRHVLGYGTPLLDGDGNARGCVATLVDITERRGIEDALRTTTERLRLLSEVTSRLLTSDDPQAVVEDLCREVMRHLDCECFFNFLADAPSGRLRLNACAGIPEEEARKIAWLDYGVAVCGCVAQEGHRIIAEDIQNAEDPRTTLVRAYGIQAYTCHPLLAGTRVLGTLSFGSKTRPAFTADETELMRIVADKVSIGMERMLAGQALAESEERYRSLFNGMTEGFSLHEVVTDERGEPCDYRFLDVNPAFERLTGLKRDDVLGRRLREVLPGEDSSWIGKFGRVAITGEPVHFEDYSPALDRWYDVFAYRPAPRQFAVIFMDITARKQAEQALARREEGLRQALRLGRSFTFEWNAVTDEVLSDEGAADILGLSADELKHDTGADYFRRVHPDDLAPLEQLIHGLSPENDSYNIFYRVIRPDGSVVCLEEITRASFDAQGVLQRLTGISADVTVRMQAEEALRRSHEELERLVDERTAELRELNEALHREIKARQRAREVASRLAAIVSSSDDAILSKTPDGVILTWNRGAERLLGYSEAEVVGRHVAFLTPDERFEETQQLLDRIQRGERIEHFETVRLCKDGSRVNVSLTVSPIFDTAGVLTGASEIAHDITDRKRMENELRQASEYARSLIEASIDPLATVDQQGTVTDVNAAMERTTGVPRRQLIGSNFAQYFTDPEKAREGFGRVLTEGILKDFALAVRHSSDGTTDVLFNATVYRNAAGEVQGVFAAARDITQRKRAEEELVRYRDHLEELVQQRTSELELAYHRLMEDVLERERLEAERLRLIDILEATPDMVSYSEVSGKVLYFNQAARKVLGIPPDADLANFVIPKGHPDWANKLLQEIALPTAMLEGLWSGETAVLDAEGNEIPVSQVIIAHNDATGQVAYLSTIARDVSAQKRAEWELKVLASFPSENPSPVLRVNEQGLLLYSNEAGEPLRKKWGCAVGEIVPPDIRKEISRAFSLGTIQESEHEAEGRIYSVLFAPVRETGHVNLYGRDITERRRMEDALVEARDRLEQRVETRTAELLQVNVALVNKIEEHARMSQALRDSQVRLAEAQRIAHLGGWEWDIRSGTLTCSEEVFRIFGISPREQAPTFPEFLRWTHHEDRKVVEQTALQAIAGKKPYNLDYRIVLPDGEIRHVHAQAEMIPDGKGAPLRLLGTIMDITERVHAEEEARIHQQQLVQADKMVSLGILVAGVAHEINNPNHSIMSNVTALSEVWEGTRPILDRFYEDFGDFVLGGFEYSECRDKLPDMFSNALANSKRIEVIVTELRDFARHSPRESMTPVDVNSVVGSAIVLMTNMVKKSTDHFSVAYGDGMPPVLGNFQRIEQVVINLIQNACQALTTRDGAVNVATSHDPASGLVVIEVCDEGTGIPEENLKQLGTPFFTTKRGGEGMGLGLWISTNIVHEHGGTLTFSAREGGGTRAVLALPAIIN